MNKTNIKECRRMLEVKREQLLSSQYDTEGIVVQRVPDSMDEFSLELQRDLTVDAINRKATLLRQIAEALERIAGGKYGVCLACQEAISPNRLTALPWAALCFECQQAEESALGTDVTANAGLRLGCSVSSHGERLADSPREHNHRFRRPPIPRAAENGGAIKPEAQL
ncbi:MAG: TraR/DksA family transcriptional regulator [Terriglobia bacterium]